MKKLFIMIFAFLFLFAGNLYAKSPEIYAPRTSFTYNNIIEGKKVLHTFEFKNTGDDNLHITRVKASG